MEELEGSQVEKLLQFQELTGIEELAECRTILQRHNWELERAVHDTLTNRDHAVERWLPVRAPGQGLLGYIISLVYNLISRSIWSAFGVFWRLIRPPDRLLLVKSMDLSAPENSEPEDRVIDSELEIEEEMQIPDETQSTESMEIVDSDNDENENQQPHHHYWPIAIYSDALARYEQAGSLGSNSSSPIEDVKQFIENFHTRYGAEVRPAFWRSSYSQALAVAKQELKFLLIYLHCQDHQNTDPFCRETLCSVLLNEYLRSANWLLWGCDVSSAEGYRVSQALRENSYPFLAVAVLRGHRMTVVSRYEGHVQPEELVPLLRNVVTENEMSLIAVRAERNERSQTNLLRQQQDEAYQESLLADQEKERRKREQQQALEEEQARLREEEEERQREKEAIARRKIDLADQIPPEPPTDQANAVHLVIKLPSGRRLERRFLPEHKLQDVFHYVFCHPDSPDQFEISQNFPRRVLQCQGDGANTSLQEAGLGGKQALFVTDLEA
ncbi:FAS-associated factor 2 isoform X1 [Neocloeon triangulifer]|uniref:FAS-associated factor 2 isoform X1 n=1 Tax=Neocloeon triangulifer TaxID=2078957 RepID=UPI00286F25E9|nr:FAS-associated factor 2 isoform X1 [Neocloeon triangulifer]